MPYAALPWRTPSPSACNLPAGAWQFPAVRCRGVGAELRAQENKAYPTYEDGDCYVISGTDGTLSVPTMRLKTYPRAEDRSWWKPFGVGVMGMVRGPAGNGGWSISARLSGAKWLRWCLPVTACRICA